MLALLGRFGPLVLAFFQHHPVTPDAGFAGSALDPAALASLARAGPQRPGGRAGPRRHLEPLRSVAVPAVDATLLARVRGAEASDAAAAPPDGDAAAAGKPAAVPAEHAPSKAAASDAASNGASGSRDALFRRRVLRFTEDHREVLNALVRVDSGLLRSFLLPLVAVRDCRVFLDFANKRKFFYEQLRAVNGRTGAALPIRVRRKHVFQDSFAALGSHSAHELRSSRPDVHFDREEGVDAGGLTREWFEVLARELFNPNYALFELSGDGSTFQPNPHSHINEDDVLYFRFAGRVLGMAVATGQMVDAHFTHSFYKHMLGVPVTYHDMEAVDPQFYKSLTQILAMEVDGAGLEMYFTAEQAFGGSVVEVELVPGGRAIPVTDANKEEYVALITAHKMCSSIRSQTDAFLEGFQELIPPSLISIFSESELELLIAGLPSIDITDLRSHTEYSGYRPGDEVIAWFWATLEEFDQQDRARFLMFVTGTSKVPVGGFKALRGQRGPQRFTVEKAFSSHESLPVAHTCFNTLTLPAYHDRDTLREKLLIAIREAGEGFGLV